MVHVCVDVWITYEYVCMYGQRMSMYVRMDGSIDTWYSASLLIFFVV